LRLPVPRFPSSRILYNLTRWLTRLTSSPPPFFVCRSGETRSVTLCSLALPPEGQAFFPPTQSGKKLLLCLQISCPSPLLPFFAVAALGCRTKSFEIPPTLPCTKPHLRRLFVSKCISSLVSEWAVKMRASLVVPPDFTRK